MIGVTFRVIAEFSYFWGSSFRMASLMYLLSKQEVTRMKKLGLVAAVKMAAFYRHQYPSRSQKNR